MKKLFGLLSTSLLVGLMSLGLVNKVDHKAEESPKNDVLEVKDVLRMGEADGSGRTVKKVAAPAAEYVMSKAKVQVTTPDSDGTVDVRFVAAIDSFDYGAARFTIEMFDGNTSKGKITREVTKAYDAIQVGEDIFTPNEAFEDDENAGSFNYLVAYTLTDMPRDVWEYGFKVTTGLKKVEDELFTEELTDEVKVVKTAIMEDNHLVFSWSPWSDISTNATISWENDFASGDVSSLDPSIEGNEDLIEQEIRQKITAEVTLQDGTVKKSSGNATPHGTTIAGKQVSIGVSGVDLRAQAYTVKVTIELADGRTVVGVKKFEQLEDVKNVKVTPTDDGKFMLTFDAVKNATNYEYRVYNDNYTNGAVVSLNSTTAIIDPLGMENGLYNIEITAKGNGYAYKTTQFLGVFEITNAQSFVEATDYYDIQLVHTGGAWEAKINFKALSQEYNVEGIKKVSNFEVYKGDNIISNAKIINWGGSPGAYDYDLDNGYHSLSFTINEYYSTNTVYTVKFLVQTGTDENPGQVYIIEFSYIVGSSTSGDFPIDNNSFTKNHFVMLLNNAYNNIDLNEFDAAIAQLIEQNYNDTLVTINSEQTSIDDATKAVNDFISYVEVLKADKDLPATKEAYLAKIKTSYDAATKYVTSDELDTIYNTAKDSISNAIASPEVISTYDTFVASFIAKVDELVDEREFEFVGATASSGNASDAIDFIGDTEERNEGTRWESASNDKEHIIFDLGENNESIVTKISIKWETARASDYDVQVSLDGIEWITVKEMRSVSGTLNDEITMDMLAEARYIKIQCIKRATGYGNSIWDFRAFGL